jgi:hypothetical protein
LLWSAQRDNGGLNILYPFWLAAFDLEQLLQKATMAEDTKMQDADAVAEEELQYGHGALTEEELEEK